VNCLERGKAPRDPDRFQASSRDEISALCKLKLSIYGTLHLVSPNDAWQSRFKPIPPSP
jgi:hypothetical protein